ncbi:SMP-30/gluconolactonase/LRE family protein [Acuticoccus sp.]|uniref:SMP-30/gluconolactonase/LRE family protein n=1 Tax=Acuticoccus sp. TaxID=1904378 RepID=UPI003B524549
MITVELVHDAHATVGESAAWDDRAKALWWCDIDGEAVHAFDPATGPRPPIAIGEKVGCLALTEAGGAVIGTKSGLYDLDLATGERALFASPEADLPDNRFNDAATDRQGRWWVGSMGMGDPSRATGAFWRVDADRSVIRWLDGIHTTNGLAFSPDGRTMYLSDSHPDVRTIWACDYDPDEGAPSNRRVYFDTRAVAGRPDGATVDADGCYWMAGVSGWQLVRLTPHGTVDMIVEMPVEKPSKPEFGGADRDTLYVTTISAGLTRGADQPHAGGLFAITGLPVGGVPTARFRG